MACNRSGPRKLVRCPRLLQRRLREVKPPGQSQRDLPRPQARPRQPTVPKKTSKAIRNLLSLPCKTTNTNQVTTSLKSSIAVSPSLLPVWGFGAAPTHQEIPREIASKTVSAKQSAGSRDAPRRTLAVARRGGCQQVFHDLNAVHCSAFFDFLTRYATPRLDAES